jgi:hypothetical protein
MDEDHNWMYNGWNKGGDHSDEWMIKTTAFLDHAFSRTKMVRCPCNGCQNMRCLEDKIEMAKDLCKYGFMPSYEVWTFHGEKSTQAIEEEEEDYSTGVDRMDEMLEDIQIEVLEDPPTAEVEAFFKLLKASEEQGFFNPMQLCASLGGCITLKEPSDILNQWLAIEQGLRGASPKHLCLRR